MKQYMKDFKNSLYNVARKAITNNYGRDNYDEYRFGKYPWSHSETKKGRIALTKKALKNIYKASFMPLPFSQKKTIDNYVDQYLPDFERTWKNLSTRDRNLYINIIAFRIFGFRKIKLPRNNAEYWSAIEKIKSLVDVNTTINPDFLHFILKKSDLREIGYDVDIFLTEKGIAIDFIIEQYAYKINNKTLIGANEGDVVLDMGACWGDTALYFADKVGDKGKVYSFEFIPGNINIFKKNILLNPHLKERIQLVPNPVTDRAGDSIFFFDNGPGSRISKDPFPEQTGTCTTETIDNLVKKEGIKKVDYIKMDIEGAEKLALEGAKETIKKFRPKLAIAIYHSLDDFATIPNWILDLDLEYEIFLDHFSIHAEETICFAIFNYGDVSTCSFHATKLFHTGEGGALFAGEQVLHNKLFYHHNFGHKGQEDFYGLGTNAKMSELQAAMGLAVLPYLEDLIEERKRVVNYFFEHLSDFPSIKIRTGTEWNFNYFPVIFESEEQLITVKKKLNRKDIFPRRYFYPGLNTMNYVEKVKLPISDQITSTILCLPVFHNLEQDILVKITEIVKEHKT